MKRFYKVNEFFDAEDNNFSLSGIANDGESYTIFTGTDFYDAVLFDYGDRKIFIPETTQPKVTFKRMFDGWKRRRANQLATAYSGLLLEYNPTENFFGEETESGSNTGLKTPTNWKSTETKTPTDWKEKHTESASNDFKHVNTEKPNLWIATDTDSASQDYIEKMIDAPGVDGYKVTETKSASNDYQEKTVEAPGVDGYKVTETKSASNDYVETQTNTRSASNDYSETETEAPGQDGWTLTDTKKTANSYKETDVQIAGYDSTQWKKNTKTNNNNGANVVSQATNVFGFDTSSATGVPQNLVNTTTAQDVSETQSGKFATEHTQQGDLINEHKTEGEMLHTKTFAGELTDEQTKQFEGELSTETETSGSMEQTKTFAGELTNETETSGSMEHSKTFEGSKIHTNQQSGTFAHEETFEGAKYNEIEQLGTFKTETEQAGTFEDKMTFGHKVTKHGNYGTKTSAAMLLEEEDLRLRDFVDMCLAEFFNKYTVYC